MDIVVIIVSAGASLLSGLVIYLLKNESLNKRVRYLEENSYSKQDVRLLIEDKMGTIRSDLEYIKEKIDKLFDYYISLKNER